MSAAVAAPTVPVLLRIEHLTKRFGGAVALDDVGIDIAAGEVHGLVGQNGSGKSTLIKCLSGYHQPDSEWTLQVGEHVLHRPLHPGEVAGLGVSFVHQDLGMLPDLSVLENLMLARMAGDRRPYIAWPAERRRAERIFEAFGLPLDPRAPLSSLRPVEQAQVAIIRAVMELRAITAHGGTSGVLVLDEATTFLDQAGQQSLHALVRSVVSEGAGVLFVSHDVREVLDLADRVTVLRDGRWVATVRTDEIGHDDLVNLIISGQRTPPSEAADDTVVPASAGGTAASAGGTAASASAGGTAASAAGSGGRGVGELRVLGLDAEHVHDVSFSARAGQIVGITGIVGSGWEVVLEHLYGARRADAGSVVIDGRETPLHRMNPTRAIGLGMVFVPSDRLTHGIVAEMTVRENVMLPVLDAMYDRGWLRLGRMAKRCAALLREHAVNPPQPAMAIGLLSGGNQQKAVLGKWLQTGPTVILLNEPTQGVDVGARQRIFATIRAAAASGAVVLYATGDWEEVVGIADEVVVVADGRVCADLSGAELTLDNVAQAAFRGTRRSADLSNATAAWERIQP